MIKGPKNAIPTLRGWAHAKTGEILKAGKISQANIDEWYGVTEPAPKIEEAQDVVYSAPEPEVVEEAAEEETIDVVYSAPKVPKASTLRKKIRNAIKR